jgi:hypothetical protein
MTDLRKAAEMALEALESAQNGMNECYEETGFDFANEQYEVEQAIQALRQALAQPEQGNSSLNYHIAESNTQLDKIVEIAIQGHASTRDAIRWAMQQEREAIITWFVEDGFFVKDGPLSEQVREKLHHSIYFDVNRRKTPEVTPEVTGDVGACVTCGAPKGEWLVDAVNMSQERVDETVKREHEPYGYLWFTHQMERRFTHYRPKEEQRIGEVTPIYTAPPKREWVGIDEKEVAWLWFWMGNREGINGYEFAKTIEAKLKERNCG